MFFLYHFLLRSSVVVVVVFVILGDHGGVLYYIFWLSHQLWFSFICFVHFFSSSSVFKMLLKSNFLCDCVCNIFCCFFLLISFLVFFIYHFFIQYTENVYNLFNTSVFMWEWMWVVYVCICEWYNCHVAQCLTRWLLLDTNWIVGHYIFFVRFASLVCLWIKWVFLEVRVEFGVMKK